MYARVKKVETICNTRAKGITKCSGIINRITCKSKQVANYSKYSNSETFSAELCNLNYVVLRKTSLILSSIVQLLLQYFRDFGRGCNPPYHRCVPWMVLHNFMQKPVEKYKP